MVVSIVGNSPSIFHEKTNKILWALILTEYPVMPENPKQDLEREFFNCKLVCYR